MRNDNNNTQQNTLKHTMMFLFISFSVLLLHTNLFYAQTIDVHSKNSVAFHFSTNTSDIVKKASISKELASNDNRTWSANWIWQEADGPANTWTCFRKKIELDNIPEFALAKIAVDSKYWLWINGNPVVFEGGLKRGPTPTDTYYEQIDLSEYLQEGSNVIAVQVWYFGKHGFSHHDSGKGGFLFECKIGEIVVKSDNSWKMMIHPAYEETVDPKPNSRLSESNVRFNSEKDILGDWISVDYDDTSWLSAVEKGVPPVAPWNELVMRPIPQLKNSGLLDYESLTVHNTPITLPYTTVARTLITAYLPYNTQITPYLEIETPDRKEIFIYTDNYYNWRDKSVRAEYIARPGVSAYESLGWMNGHSVVYSIPVGVQIKALKYRETGYNAEMSGSFVSNDNFFNKLWSKAQRTLYIAMRDNYMDCPDRERALWWGDAVIQIGKSFYALDRNSDSLAKKSINTLINWQRNDDVLFSPVPAGNWNQELPSQMLASVGEYGFWNYFMYSGDSTTIRDAYPHVKKYLNVWTLGADGLLLYREGGWDWLDWGENIDAEVVQNAWYYLALKAAKKMAVLTDNATDTLFFNNRMLSLKNSFNKTFWDGTAYRSPAYTGQIDERANALAVLAGFADFSKWSAIRNILISERNASPYMEKYVLEALFVMGYENDALARMKHPDRYKPMVDDPGSTLFEFFGNGGSYNHAWSGGPLTLLSQYSTGVAPFSPGFKVYKVFPQEGELTHIKTLVPSIRGNIEVEINKDTTNYSLNLISPENTIAMVGIPLSPYFNKKPASIKMNDSIVWEDNRFVGNNTEIHLRGVTDKYVVFGVQPGAYHFDAELENNIVSGITKKRDNNLFSSRITPNPAADYIHIQFNKPYMQTTHISLYNLYGKLLATYEANDHGITLDLSVLSQGVYMLKMLNGQSSGVEFFIKQ